MELRLKYKIVFWLMIFLLVVNFTTISVIFLRVKKLENIISENKRFEKGRFFAGSKPIMKRFNHFLFHQINLTEQQRTQITELKKAFHHQQKQCIDSLHFYRRIFDLELEKINPDYQKMLYASYKMGEFQKCLRENFIFYYQKLKQILDEKQNKKLAQFFANINSQIYKK